jgi:hypothetical protein
MRVGRSLSGPHRLVTTREFYIRRGERTARMAVREIKDATLELARTGDRLEQLFSERSAGARELFSALAREPDKGAPPLLMRVSGLPTTPQNISRITSRPDLWWRGGSFTMTIDGHPLPCPYPAREYDQPPRIRLRSFEIDDRSSAPRTQRLVRGDGLVEFSFVRPTREPIEHWGANSPLYVGWLLSLVVGTISQIEHLRQHLAWDGVDFGLQIEIWSAGPIAVVLSDKFVMESNSLPEARPFAMPRYSIGPSANFDALVTSIVQDLFNACGVSANWPCTLPWHQLIKS